jgi:hypothetical protein
MRLRCHERFDLGNRRGLSRMIDVVDDLGKDLDHYLFMCWSIDNDIQTVQGSGADALECIRRIEVCELPKIELGGNGWITHIAHGKVWFEGVYSQGEGGEVSLAQYKFAVQTYLQFLSDPESKPIEVAFPEA